MGYNNDCKSFNNGRRANGGVRRHDANCQCDRCLLILRFRKQYKADKHTAGRNREHRNANRCKNNERACHLNRHNDCSDSEHSETERKDLCRQDGCKARHAKKQVYHDDEFKRNDSLQKCAEEDHEREKDNQAFARKDKELCCQRDKNQRKKRKCHVRKFFEKKWEEDVCNSEDENRFIRDECKSGRKSHQKDDHEKECKLSKCDNIRKECEDKSCCAEDDKARRNGIKKHAYCSEGDKSHDNHQDNCSDNYNRGKYHMKDDCGRANCFDGKSDCCSNLNNNRKDAKFHQGNHNNNLNAHRNVCCDNNNKCFRKNSNCGDDICCNENKCGGGNFDGNSFSSGSANFSVNASGSYSD